MPESKKEIKDSDLKEIVISLMQGLDSVVDLLEEKGILTRREYLSKLNKLKAQRNTSGR